MAVQCNAVVVASSAMLPGVLFVACGVYHSIFTVLEQMLLIVIVSSAVQAPMLSSTIRFSLNHGFATVDEALEMSLEYFLKALKTKISLVSLFQ